MVSRYSALTPTRPRVLTSWDGIDDVFATAAPTSATWPTANKAFYRRVYNPVGFTPSHAFVYNGATAAGNIDIALYDTAYGRLGSIGSTAQSGTSVVQYVTFTTAIPQGELIIGLALSDATATIGRTASIAATWAESIGGAQQASAFALPATAVPAAPADFPWVPYFGFLDKLD